MAAAERTGAVATGPLGDTAPPEPPDEPPVVVPLDRVEELTVEVLLVPLDCGADVGDVVTLVVVVGEGEVVVGVEGALGLSTGTGDVGTETVVEGKGGLVDTVTSGDVVETSASTGPRVTFVGTSAADACAVASSDTIAGTHRHTSADREHPPSARLETARLDIRDWNACLNIPD